MGDRQQIGERDQLEGRHRQQVGQCAALPEVQAGAGLAVPVVRGDVAGGRGPLLDQIDHPALERGHGHRVLAPLRHPPERHERPHMPEIGVLDHLGVLADRLRRLRTHHRLLSQDRLQSLDAHSLLPLRCAYKHTMLMLM